MKNRSKPIAQRSGAKKSQENYGENRTRQTAKNQAEIPVREAAAASLPSDSSSGGATSSAPSAQFTLSHEQIAERARMIWEREGCPSGRDTEFWLQAESELKSSRT